MKESGNAGIDSGRGGGVAGGDQRQRNPACRQWERGKLTADDVEPAPNRD